MKEYIFEALTWKTKEKIASLENLELESERLKWIFPNYENLIYTNFDVNFMEEFKIDFTSENYLSELPWIELKPYEWIDTDEGLAEAV